MQSGTRRVLWKAIRFGASGAALTFLTAVVMPQVWPGFFWESTAESSTGDQRWNGVFVTGYRRHFVAEYVTPPCPDDASAMFKGLVQQRYDRSPPVCIMYTPAATHLWWAANLSGVPFRCSWYWTADSATTLVRTGDRILFDEVRNPLTTWPVYIPTGVIWWALAADILLWGVASSMVMPAIHGIRGSLRRRRGRCPRCAYDLRGDLKAGCPECGWARSPRQSARPS